MTDLELHRLQWIELLNRSEQSARIWRRILMRQEDERIDAERESANAHH